MNISDDTVLQFFRDLVRDFSQPHFSEAEFLQQQYAVIEAYVEHFPANERDSQALAWIEANAGQYRSAVGRSAEQSLVRAGWEQEVKSNKVDVERVHRTAGGIKVLDAG